ncbi:MAG: glycosyltransferase [Candidatus Magasanikbacteria bacterium]|nr:glycosyltransferase [Candidatus Magasanikbacteria bacterium]
MKIALVHDYLSQDGGAERVLQAFHELWPEAPIFVLFHDRKKISDFSKDADVRQSFIAKMPFGKTRYQWYLPWMPLATERHDLNRFDVVLSSTSAFAKGVLTRPDTFHVSYCHTPTRYLWTDTYKYLADLKYNRVVKSLLPRLIHKLRLWDKMSVDRVDRFIANSRTVQGRIAKYYRRESDVIYPPVDVERFYISNDIGSYFVSGGRLVPYKRFDLLVQAFNRLKVPLKIFGSGPELESLRKRARRNIQFLGKINEKDKADLLSRAKAFVHPQVEDLGITPIESMASGRPVIAYREGGVTETLIPGRTGIFFHEQNWESLYDAVLNFDPYAWNSQDIRHWAERFDKKQFKERMRRYVENHYEEFLRGLNQCRLDFYVNNNKIFNF